MGADPGAWGRPLPATALASVSRQGRSGHLSGHGRRRRRLAEGAGASPTPPPRWRDNGRGSKAARRPAAHACAGGAARALPSRPAAAQKAEANKSRRHGQLRPRGGCGTAGVRAGPVGEAALHVAYPV
jgi:hypothetical protein